MIGGVYLAYPIDQRGPASLVYMFDQIEKIKRAMIELGMATWVFDPGDAFHVNVNTGADGGVAAVNRCAVNFADLLIAFLPAGVATIGVPMEIDRARAQGKHVIVVSEVESYMLNMSGIYRINGWQDADIEQMLTWISKLDPPIVNKQYHDLRFKIGPEGELPKRTYDDDAGLDLFVSEDVVIQPNSFVDVPCDVSVELPGHTWGLVTGRSSALRKRGLLIHSGVIDAGYRGELYSGAWNLTDREVTVTKGERIAQLIILNNATKYLTPIVAEQLSESTRGASGFGSSGA